jgi:two-component system, chemotaxis family, protein-glutamate methylesterase/glutaminase
MRKEKLRDSSIYIVDPHVLMRQILASMLRKLDGVCVMKSTNSADIDEIEKVMDKNMPDLVFLGIESMESEGMVLFHHLRKNYPELPVCVLTSLNEEGGKIALHCLKYGAVDYITKPDRTKGLILASRHFFKRVIPIIRSLKEINRELLKKNDPIFSPGMESNEVTLGRLRISPEKVDLVILAGCTGGVRSLYRLISKLPNYMPVPVLIVQHMPKIYTQQLAAELDRISPLNIREATNKSLLLPGQVYVAPGGYHTVVKNEGSRKMLYMHRGPREHKCRPSVDVTLRSAVQAYNSRILSVFLSGGGNDGVNGARYLYDSGGLIILESKESSLMWDTSKKIQDMGVSDGVYNADQLSKEIMKRVLSKKRENTLLPAKIYSFGESMRTD